MSVQRWGVHYLQRQWSKDGLFMGGSNQMSLEEYAG